MRADSISDAIAAASFLDIDIDPHQAEQLHSFHGFLATDAMVAGGIGPNEVDRLWRRHIADSILFGIDIGSAKTCLDIGTGMGLPGIPLAILFPTVEFTLLDRAGRRVDLIRRACAILGLPNCGVVHADISAIEARYDRIVSRGSLPPDRLLFHVKRLLDRPGVATIGLSHGETALKRLPKDRDVHVSVIEIPPEVLDTPVSLLRIEAT